MKNRSGQSLVGMILAFGIGSAMILASIGLYNGSRMFSKKNESKYDTLYNASLFKKRLFRDIEMAYQSTVNPSGSILQLGQKQIRGSASTVTDEIVEYRKLSDVCKEKGVPIDCIARVNTTADTTSFFYNLTDFESCVVMIGTDCDLKNEIGLPEMADESSRMVLVKIGLKGKGALFFIHEPNPLLYDGSNIPVSKDIITLD